MKLRVISSAADGRIDGSIADGILSRIQTVQSGEDAVIVPVSYLHDYRFNEALRGVRSRVVIIDFTEFGWEAGTKPNILGTGVIRNFGHLDSPEWGKLDQWAAGANIIAHFKRELMKRDVSPVHLPVEYLCRLPIPPRQSREEFQRRPMEVFSSWGLSNPVRQVLHGDIFKHAHTSGIHVVDAWDQDQHFDGKTWDSKWPKDGKVWATIHCPHYNRKPMAEVMRWQQRAKLSVSLPGSGVKCFRSAEAAIGSIMALQEDELAWSYDWTDGENCIRLKRGKEFKRLLEASGRDLYDIYCASQETIARYQPRNYVTDYLLPAIEARLSGNPAPRRRKIPAAVPHQGGAQFLHRGDLGDIIACLPAIRASGGGELVIAPHTGTAMQGRQDLRGPRFNAIRPLLEIQPYIQGCRWVEESPDYAVDFSTFRTNTIPDQSLSLHQARHIGVTISEEPWLHNVEPRDGLADKIIVARTSRYHNWKFPWREIVKEHRDRILFIGMPDEHKAFCKLVGPVEYLPTANLLEVAQTIAGSQVLISNQTVACWIGLGLGHRLIQEQWPVSRDSMIPRPNAQYILYGEMPKIPPASTSRPILIAKQLQQGKPTATVDIVFPFYATDKPQAQALAELIRDVGGVENHRCLIVCPDGTDRTGVEEPLREAFGAVDVHTYAATLSGWPHGPNEMFAEAAMLIARDPRFHDFLWMEPDVVILPGWADGIESSYRACGMPVLGVSTDTVAMDSRQVVGRHIVGVAVYPKGFAQLCPLVKSVKSMSLEYKRANAMPKAFDAYFGAYTVARNSETRLIQHFWRSSDFREEGGAIVAHKTVSPGVENTVSPDAVLLHGCKDGSLLEIVRRRIGMNAPRTSKEIEKSMASESGRVGPALVAATNRIERGANAILGADGQKPPKGKLPIIPPEQWIRGADGLPIPPFMKGQPEWERQRTLKIGSLESGGFKKLRDYARKNLKVNTLRLTADKIIEQCVLAERRAGKEEWTKGIASAAKPPAMKAIPPQHSILPPNALPSADDGISPAMRAKMLEMRRQRGMPVTA